MIAGTCEKCLTEAERLRGLGGVRLCDDCYEPIAEARRRLSELLNSPMVGRLGDPEGYAIPTSDWLTMTWAELSDITLELDPSEIISANQRLHWAKRAKLTRRLRDKAHVRARSEGLAKRDTRTRIIVHVTYPNNRRRRDAANLQPTIKALVDGIVVDYGLLPDDNDTWVVGPDIRVEGHDGDGKYKFRIDFEAVNDGA